MSAPSPWLDPADRESSEAAFVGRRVELDTLATCVKRARRGAGQVVWIEGPAGSGKTALVRQAVADVGDRCRVFWGAADELSVEASFSLLSPFAPIDTSSAFAAGMRLLERLQQPAGDAVVVVIEDLHWADAASRGAFLTLARRLRHDHVMLVVTTRPDAGLDGWNRFVYEPGACVRLVLAGLDEREVVELAGRFGISLSATQGARLHRHTTGSPLYVRTLLAELTPRELLGDVEPLPAPRSLAAVTVAALAALPAESCELAAALAVLGARTPLMTVGAVASVAHPAEALEPLVATGLVCWAPTEDGTPVEFAHPLYRSAAYEDLAPARRRDLHLAAAAVTRWGTSWAHRVAAAESSDDDLADELKAGSDYEIARRDLALAATYLSMSSSMSSTRERAEDRLLRSVRLLLIDGQTARAESLFARVEQCAETALRDLVIGMLMFARADALAAERWLSGVSRLDGPDWVHADALGHLALLYALKGRGGDVVDAAQSALARGPFDPVGTDLNVWWALAIGEAMSRGAPAGVARLRERLPEAPTKVRPDDAELLAARGMLRNLAGRTREAVDDLRTAISMARQGAGFRQLPRAHLALASALFNAGAWDDSQLQSRTALSLMDDHHVWLRAQAEGSLVPVLAARGDLVEAAAHNASAVAAAGRLQTAEIDGVARIGSAAIARATGDPHGVIGAFGPFAAGTDGYGGTIGLLVWWPPLLAARIEAGQLDDLGADIDALADAGRAMSLDVTVHVADLHARLAVAQGRPDEAEPWFELAVSSLGPDHPALDGALLHHAYGRFLRARGNRRRAVDHLRTAHELLAELGAEPYRRAVADDIAGWGGVEVERRSERTRLALTPRERDVVSLVNKGLTNNEIGAQLYVSAKAVEYHLGNVYGKLGIRSRRELRDLVPTT